MEELKRNSAGGFDVVHYDGVLNDFWWFIEERNRITEKKLSGKPWPWTSDEILQKVKINNLNRKYDFGSQYIIDKVNKHPEIAVQIIYVYRFTGSNIKLMDELLKHPVNSWPEVMGDKVLFYSKAYQRPNFPKGKGSGRYFIKTHSINMSYKLDEMLKHFKGSIKELVHLMCEQYPTFKSEDGLPYKNMIFHSNEVVKDLTYFPIGKNIDPHGDCEIGAGAKKGLQLLFNNVRYDSNFRALQEMEEYKRLNINPDILEGSLCEFRKYREYKSGKRIRPNNVYKPRKNTSGWNEPVSQPEVNEELGSVKVV